MHINTLDAQSTLHLEQLVAKSSFLHLTNSSEQYPSAPGTGLPLLIVETELCSAVISLQGAHLLEFKTTSGDPLLWLSPNCDFSAGTALRGGVPLCLPWFGVNQSDASKPKHGFARNNFWELGEARQLTDGSVALEFVFVSDANDLFPFDFSAELRMVLGNSAKLELTINNTDTEDFDCSWAMHNYHRVSSLTDVRVLGLAERKYLDNFEGHAEKHQAGDLSFPGPVDRVFPDIQNPVTIKGSPSIEITHSNCPSVVTWNPGAEAARGIADIGEGQEQFYICLERGAVLSEQWHLPAGTSKSAWMEFKQI
ncbi:D-hexose-6-phosphate mutarotase [Cellvibrio sp. OA-2007]|uniref:D-hexose-6-phosphate mutarotase n=1 Tax=Cellvibrio sp. OA-2007 TaxID=529823 RepID=UPI000A86FADF|nr:D-hexose-6-phosphate mutarotase [Cellvibrio sp. OA-2007]